ncbi:uncharacterized protein RJT21DRAFT_89605 [Scheffersomyces amazonensis]|uniref:uncharacterized protein n=1 Tax=Scheffersomyces amazonensis TaxID=1078765 RepID=UPI00315D2920
MTVQTSITSTNERSPSPTKHAVLLGSTSTSSSTSSSSSSTRSASDLSPSYSPSDSASSTSSNNIASRPPSPSKSRPLTPPTTSTSNITTNSPSVNSSPKQKSNIDNTTTNTNTNTTNNKKSIPYYYSNQDNFLQLIEPFPVSPPAYDTLPPGGCPRYPVINHHPAPHQEQLPNYSPSIYKIGIVARKMEWLTPFEASPSRSWKHIIMELNSTQLNFYSIPSNLETHLLSFKPIPQSIDRTYNEFEESELRNLISHFTDDHDLQFFKFCQRLNIIESSSSSSSLSSSTPSNVTNKKLIRSYSLQHSRIGLAVDYKKRPNVLRLRIESEQILLSFSNTKDLIDWNMAINIGKDIALDLNDRELPKYRTVPRRRRRSTGNASTSNTTTSNHEQLIHQVLNKRLRSQSDPNSKLRGKLSKLKFKFGSSSTSITPLKASSSPLASTTMSPSSSGNRHNSTPSTSTTTPTTSSKLQPVRSNSVPTFSIYSESEYEDDSALNSTFEDEDDYDEEDYELLSRASETSISRRAPASTVNSRTRSNTIPEIVMTTPTVATSLSVSTYNEDYDEEDIQNLSDLHHSDDEEDEEDEVEEESQPNPNDLAIEESLLSSCSTPQPINRPSSTYSRFEDYKWNPAEKAPSKRRYYKNCLRCIKPLTMEDSWVSKSLVKPTSLSPLSFAYLKHVKYNTPASNTSLVSLNSSIFSSPSTTSLSNYIMDSPSTNSSSSKSSRKPRSFSMGGFNLPETALTKVPNHFLKEYLVGSHGLIPKEL